MSAADRHSELRAEGLKIGYRGQANGARVVAEEINGTVKSGELICLMGPNGSGKSTLIKTLAGMQPPLGGRVLIDDKPLDDFSLAAIARQLSTVLTDRIAVGNLSVFELVSFGRSPYTGWLGRLREEDIAMAQWALEATGFQSFSDRNIQSLSDGERQKVMIARALAQDTNVILLDEPTAHLDLPNRVEVIRLLRRLARETEKGILLSTHELDLALKAGDQAWLIDAEGTLQAGVPEDLVLNGTFERTFDRESFTFDRLTGSFKLHQATREAISISGDPVAAFWTQRALEREGFKITNNDQTGLSVQATTVADDFRWLLQAGGKKQAFDSVRALIAFINENRIS